MLEANINEQHTLYENGTIVKTYKNGKQITMKPTISKTMRYYLSRYTENGVRKGIATHRLLALYFLPVPYRYRNIPVEELVVDHINSDTLDNRLSNLQWCTREENLNITYDRIKSDNIPLLLIKPNGDKVYYRSHSSLLEKTGISSKLRNEPILKGKGKNCVIIELTDGKLIRG